MIGSNKGDVFDRSFTYTRIRSGPKIDRWGVPQIMYVRSDLLFSPNSFFYKNK